MSQTEPGSQNRPDTDVVARRLESTPQPQADAALVVTAGKRAALRPTGKAFDAAAATRAEREAQARRGSRR